jgi:hypothetical protein
LHWRQRVTGDGLSQLQILLDYVCAPRSDALGE